MTERHASFLISDELLVSLNGKFFIHGVYTGDIVIAAEEQRLNQLVLFLQISTPTQKPFRKLELRLSLPGEDNPRIVDLIPLLPMMVELPGRTTSAYKVPVPIISPNLKTGPIEVHLIHDEGELFVGRQWIAGPTRAQEIQKQIGETVKTLRN
jgi:hypothetical protein